MSSTVVVVFATGFSYHGIFPFAEPHQNGGGRYPKKIVYTGNSLHIDVSSVAKASLVLGDCGWDEEEKYQEKIMLTITPQSQNPISWSFPS